MAKLDAEIDGHVRRATDAKERFEASTRDFTRKENDLKEQANRAGSLHDRSHLPALPSLKHYFCS